MQEIKNICENNTEQECAQEDKKQHLGDLLESEFRFTCKAFMIIHIVKKEIVDGVVVYAHCMSCCNLDFRMLRQC